LRGPSPSGLLPGRSGLGFRRRGIVDHLQVFRRIFLKVLQAIFAAEAHEAVGLADELAALDGVDGLFLGPEDLFIREGTDVDTAKTRETLGRKNRMIAAACQRHGKLNVGHGVSEDTLAIAKECSFRLVVGGGDVGFLAGGSKSASKKVRDYFK